MNRLWEKNLKFLGFFIILILVSFIRMEQADAAEVFPEVPVASNVQTAQTWGEFISYLGNSTVDQINLGQNITAEGSINEADFPSRNLTINGGTAKNQLNMAGYTIRPGTAAAGTLLSFVDVSFVGSGITYAILTSTTENSTNWIINYVGCSLSAANNDKRLISASNSKVFISGGMDIKNTYTSDNAGIMRVKELSIKDRFNYLAANTGVTALTIAPLVYFSVNDTKIVLQDSDFTARTSGTIFSNSVTGNSSSFQVENTQLTIPDADKFYSGAGSITANFVNSPVNLGRLTSTFIRTSGASSKTTIHLENSPVTGAASGSLFYTSGEKSSIDLTLEGSPVDVPELFGVVKATQNTSTATATIKDSPITIATLKGSLIYAGKVTSTLENSPIRITTDVISDIFAVTSDSSTGSAITFTQSDLYVRQSGSADYTGFEIYGQTNLTVDNSDFDIDMKYRPFWFLPTATSSKFIVKNGSTVSANSAISRAFEAANVELGSGNKYTNDFQFLVDGANTTVRLSSTSTLSNISGVLAIYSDTSLISVTDGATLDVKSLDSTKATSAIYYRGSDTTINISGYSTLNVENLSGMDINSSPMNLGYETGGVAFNILDHSIVSVKSRKSTAPAIQLSSANNNISVKGGSTLDVQNKGSGSLVSTTGVNAGIYYRSFDFSQQLNSFTVMDEDSSISIIADYGGAIIGNSAYTELDINSGAGTYFQVRGQMYTSTAGIFNAHKITINLGTMKYYDFTNTRVNGGTIFKTNNTNSTTNFDTSNLSLWKISQGVKVNGTPSKAFEDVMFSLTDYAFQTFVSGSTEVKAYLNGNYGLANFTRLSGNNQRGNVDEIRVPTNADKHLWAHVSVDEGKNEKARDAWEGEVGLQLTVKNPDNSVAYQVEGIVGAADMDVYGTKRSGMVKIPIPNGQFFTAGQTVEATKVWQVKNPTLSGKILTGVVEGIDVTPPKQTIVTTNVTNAAKQLTGTSEENGASVFVKVNGQWLRNENNEVVATVVNNNSWTLDLPYYLTKEDTVEIYLKDHALIEPQPSFDLPRTYTLDPNNQYGNLNEDKSGYDLFAGYHDAIKSGDADYRFAPALQVKTIDVLPNPQVVKAVSSSGGSKTAIGDVLTYTVTVKNDKSGSEAWGSVQLTDTISSYLTFNSVTSGITLNGVSLSDDQYDYDEATRVLTVDIGDIPASETAVLSFKTVVADNALNQTITNKATARGNSPRESPFVPGPNNPDATFVIIEKESNEVGIPGGTAMGTLSLGAAPTTVNFGSLTYNAKVQRVDAPTIDDELVVTDTRGPNSGGWILYAALTADMTDTVTGSVMNEALWYVNNDGDEIPLTLDDGNQVVYTNAAGGTFDVSSTWGNTSESPGLKLIADPTKTTVSSVGSYTGVVTWTIMAGQP